MRLRSEQGASAARWAGCFLLVLAAHAAAAALLMHRPWPISDAIASAPVITVALALLAAAPDIAEPPPAPVASQAQPDAAPPPPASEPEQPDSALPPVPAQQTAPAPAVQAQSPTPTMPPPPRPRHAPEHKQAAKPHLKRRASSAAAPPRAERRDARAAAPAPGPTAHDPNAAPNWKSRLVAQIERHKRYPAAAEAQGDEGVAEVAFSVDRRGGVHHPRLVRSTGSPLLDRDALAWLTRASPLPPPPPEVTGALIPIVVPLRYKFR